MAMVSYAEMQLWRSLGEELMTLGNEYNISLTIRQQQPLGASMHCQNTVNNPRNRGQSLLSCKDINKKWKARTKSF